MNLKSLVIALLLACCSNLVSAQYQYVQKLGNQATINLPDTPTIKKSEGLNVYVARYKNVIFFAQTSEVHAGLRNVFSAHKVDSIYSGYIRGTLKGTGGKSTFYNNKIKINGHEGIEFGYKAPLNDQQTYRYNRAVYLNDTLLMCGIWASDSLSKDDPNLKPFFDGFKVKTADELSSIQASEWGYKTGKAIGILLTLCIPVLLGLGIVFIIRRLIYKKDKKSYPSIDKDNS